MVLGTMTSRRPKGRGGVEHLSKRDRVRALVALVTAVVLFGSAFVGIRAVISSDAYSPILLTTGRMFVASVLIALVVVARGGVRVPARRDWPAFLLLGALGQTLYQVLLSTGERTVDSGTAALLVSCSPIIASLLAVAFLGEKLTWQGWVGTGVAFVGATLIAAAAGLSLELGSGVIMVLVATLIWASYQVVQKTVAHGYGALELTAWPTWIASAALLPWLFRLPQAVASAPLPASAGIVWLGAGSSVAGFLAWSYAIKRLPVVVFSNALFTVPVAAFLIAWVLLGEVPSVGAVVGGAVTLVGVGLLQTRGRPVAAVSPAAAEA